MKEGGMSDIKFYQKLELWHGRYHKPILMLSREFSLVILLRLVHQEDGLITGQWLLPENHELVIVDLETQQIVDG